jgi:hypothetical protein
MCGASRSQALLHSRLAMALQQHGQVGGILRQ